MTAFVVNLHRDGDVMDVSVVGEVDIATAPTMLEAASAALAQETVRTVRVDMSQVSFVDSCGLKALVELRQAARMLEKSVVLLAPRPAQLHLLELTGLDTLFVIESPSNTPDLSAG